MSGRRSCLHAAAAACAVILLFLTAALSLTAGGAGLPGDVNGDGDRTAVDYLMLKRAVLLSLTLNADQESRADVNGDGSIDARDYLLLKRHILGTYTIPDGGPGEEPPGGESSSGDIDLPEIPY